MVLAIAICHGRKLFWSGNKTQEDNKAKKKNLLTKNKWDDYLQNVYNKNSGTGHMAMEGESLPYAHKTKTHTLNKKNTKAHKL